MNAFGRLEVLVMCALFVMVFSGANCGGGGSGGGGGGPSASRPPAPPPPPPARPAPVPEDSTRLVAPNPPAQEPGGGGPRGVEPPRTNERPRNEAPAVVEKPYVPPPQISDTPPAVSAPRYKTIVAIPEIVGTAAQYANKGRSGSGSKGLKPLDDEIDASRLSASAAHAPESALGLLEAPRGALAEDAKVLSIPAIESAADSGEQSREFARSALLKMKMSDYKGALQDASKAVALDPTNADAYLVRARTYARMKDYARAETDALSAVRVAPANAEAWHVAAWTQMQQGKFKDALSSVTRAIELDPDNASNFAMRAMIREKLGDRDGALDDLRRASRLDGRYKEAYRSAKKGGRIFESLQDDAFALLDEVSSGGRRPVAPSLYGALAVFLGSLGWGLWAFLRRKEKDEDASFRTKMATLREPPPAADDGKIAGKYEVLRMIGRGGMGQVFAARDHSLGREVAVKRIAEAFSQLDARAKERVLAEAKTVAALHHPAIVDIYEVIERGPELFLVFELLAGKTAAQLLVEEKRLAPRRTLELLRPVCQALDFAHGKGVIHRDLKPSNIMVTATGHVKLMDFGIARSTDKPLAAAVAAAAPREADKLFVARTETVAGTPAYMPPEAERGEVRRESDVYSLAACAYEMLTGAAPFAPPARLIDKVDMRFQAPSLRVPGLGEAFDRLMTDALQPDPEKRMKTAGEFLSRLEAAVSAKG